MLQARQSSSLLNDGKLYSRKFHFILIREVFRYSVRKNVWTARVAGSQASAEQL